MEYAPDDGTHAVGANEQVAFGRAVVRHLQGDAVPGQGESSRMTSENDGVRADSIKQRAVERRAQRDDHRAAQHVRWQRRPLHDGTVEPAQFCAPRLEAASEHRVGDTQLS